MKRSGLFVVVICIAVSVGSADAEFVEFEFGGIVTDTVWNEEPPWDQVQVGDMWSISYVFESTTPDTFPVDELQERLGYYHFAIKSYEFSVGSITVSDSTSSVVGHIDVYNGYPTGYDQYEVFISFPTGMTMGPWFMQLDDPTDSAWSTDKLPLCGDIDLDNFAIKDFRLSIDDIFESEITGAVEYHNCQVIPEPTTLSLLALGAILAGRRKHRA